ncbi:5043_t:CDS:1, partial [Racocetra persica]
MTYPDLNFQQSRNTSTNMTYPDLNFQRSRNTSTTTHPDLTYQQPPTLEYF